MLLHNESRVSHHARTACALGLFAIAHSAHPYAMSKFELNDVSDVDQSRLIGAALHRQLLTIGQGHLAMVASPAFPSVCQSGSTWIERDKTTSAACHLLQQVSATLQAHEAGLIAKLSIPARATSGTT